MSLKLKKAIQSINKSISFASSAAIGVITTTSVFAQDVRVEEEVVVTGIRGALTNAVNIKRNSHAVVDSISAEDIGSFPDNNVAESLGRVPGVSVSRQFGEGSEVSIRGASNQLTLTTLNGQNVASAGWYSQTAINRSFNYSMLPPELIAGLDVYKSSQANLTEGGVGGTVVVKTRKPLDLDPLTLFGSINATQSSISDETDANYSGLVSWKNEEANFGFLAAFAVSDFTLERRGYEALPAWGGRVSAVNFEQERERTAANLALQYQPTDALQFNVEYLNLELGADSVNTAIWVPQDTSNCVRNPQGAPIRCTTSEAFANSGADGQAFWDVRPRNATMETEMFSFETSYTQDAISIEVKAGRSEATGGTDFETNVAFLSLSSGAAGTIDATGDIVDFQLTNPSFPLPNAGEYAAWQGLQTASIVNQPRTDEETYGQIDINFDVELGAINSIKAGIRVTDHEVMQNARRPTLPTFDAQAEAAANDASRFTRGTLVAGTNDDFTIDAPNVGEIINYTQSFIGEFVQQRSGFGEISEENTAAYVMAEFEGDGFRGNVGLRYVGTDVEARAYRADPTFVDPSNTFNNGYSTDFRIDEHDYSEVLPSVNLSFDVVDDVQLRFTAAQVISRPNYNDLFNNESLLGYADTVVGNEVVVRGTPTLSPFKAFQSDISLEWYFNEGSLLSATYFIKEVNTFTTFTNLQNQQIGLVDPNSGVDSWSIQTLRDGDGGDIEGVELQFQHTLQNGFGGLANYTYADANANADNFVDGNNVFDDSSEHTVNLVLFYETDRFSLQGAYNWRSEYFIREIGFYGNRLHDDFGTLDLSATFNITENITLNFDANNITEEDSIQVGQDQGATATNFRTSFDYPAYSYQGEARYTLGLSFRF